MAGTDTNAAAAAVDRLLAIMAALRTPVTGCPWDLAQNFATIAPYTIEEAYEVADAIERGDMDDLKDELGDLLLQVAFHARMAQETGAFDFGDVADAISDKLVRRHPHVFGDDRLATPDEVKARWETIKAEEAAARRQRRNGGDDAAHRHLDAVGSAFPALTVALKLQKKAAEVGFDWQRPGPVLAKIREEIDEVEAELDDTANNRERLTGEIGDLLFAVVNLARHVGIDPEIALRHSNTKFRNRFNYIEDQLKEKDSDLDRASLEEMEALWQGAKGMGG